MVCTEMRVYYGGYIFVPANKWAKSVDIHSVHGIEKIKYNKPIHLIQYCLLVAVGSAGFCAKQNSKWNCQCIFG